MKRLSPITAVAGLIWVMGAMAVSAEKEMKGPVCVVDGDTIMFGGKRKYTLCEGGKLLD
ncbi:MAG: hypothetical protein VW268_10595 [Rhodospirillaceae bacterium]